MIGLDGLLGLGLGCIRVLQACRTHRGSCGAWNSKIAVALISKIVTMIPEGTLPYFEIPAGMWQWLEGSRI